MSNDDDDVRYCIILLGFIWGEEGGGDFAHFLDGFGLFFVIGTCYFSLFLYLLSMITY